MTGISDIEAFQNVDLAGMKRGHYLSKALLPTRLSRAGMRKQATAFSLFGICLQFQITCVNLSFLSRRPCHMLKMKIDKSFAKDQGKPDGRPNKLQ
jgi:hypothetical protein